jgi:nucleoside-diphosphate-sugar epimerase
VVDIIATNVDPGECSVGDKHGRPHRPERAASWWRHDGGRVSTVLVTGATGFVGRSLCTRLHGLDIDVRMAVRGPESVMLAEPPTRTAMVVGDIGPKTEWMEALNGVDVVVHLAARVHVMRETTVDPLAEFRNVNVAGTERLARQAASCGVRRLVFLSSIKVNGEVTRNKPYTEDDEPHPEDAYGISKREAEQVLWRVADETGLEVVIIRPPLVYGPGVKGNFLTMLKIVRRGIPLPLGGVTNRRSLIYVENLADAIVLAATHPLAAGNTFLVSDGEDVSTSELLRSLARLLDAPSRLVAVPPSLLRLAGRLAGKSKAVERLLGSLCVDNGKIRRILGWQPPFTVAEGLAKTASWFKGHDA